MCEFGMNGQVPKSAAVLVVRQEILAPIYGHQWRNFAATPDGQGGWLDDGVDQIKELLRMLQENPSSRRLIVSGWNPKEADQVALPPCHTLFQFYVDTERKELSCQLYQRSGDVFWACLLISRATVCSS